MIRRRSPDPRQIADPGMGEDQAGVGEFARQLDRVSPQRRDPAPSVDEEFRHTLMLPSCRDKHWTNWTLDKDARQSLVDYGQP